MLEINLNKADVIANRHFLKEMFGNEHPYGEMIMPEQYDKITSADLVDFHKTNYLQISSGDLCCRKDR